MDDRGRGMISLEFATEDYINLHLHEGSSEEVWEQAIDMVKARFNDRYFNVINYLSHSYRTRYWDEEKIKMNGFTIMALICLLVDTFYQFENGVEKAPQGENSKKYKEFLEKNFPDIFPRTSPNSTSLSTLFYKHIRCGILHSAQTSGISRLSPKAGIPAVDFFYNRGEVGIIVSVPEMIIRLSEYFDRYINALRNGDVILRRNFINKMKFVCNIKYQDIV